MIKTIEIFHVGGHSAVCDGGCPVFGHPRVYLAIPKSCRVVCPYCGRVFECEAGKNVQPEYRLGFRAELTMGNNNGLSSQSSQSADGAEIVTEPSPISVLKEGMLLWNRWRKERRSDEPIRFSKATITNDSLGIDTIEGNKQTAFDLSHVDFRDCVLENLTIKFVNLSAATFKSTFNNVRFIECTMEGADFSDSIFKGCRFEGSVKGAKFNRAKFEGQCTFDFTHVERCDFGRCDLDATQFREAVIVKCCISDIQSAELDLSDAEVKETDWTEADLSDAKLKNSRWERAYLTEVNLSRADVTDAKGLIFDKTRINDVRE